MKKDFRQLPAKGFAAKPLPPIAPVEHTRLTIVDKDTRSVAYSLGFPIIVKRGQPDYPALLVATSYFGQHRMSGGRLYQRMRELRGLNYGDYAYIEYFPRGMYHVRAQPEPGAPTSRSSRSGSGPWSAPPPASRCGWPCSS